VGARSALLGASASRCRDVLVADPCGRRPVGNRSRDQRVERSALVNAGWASSTYHSMEISFALGEGSYEGQPVLKRPCPIMAYVEEPESRHVRDHWMQSRIEAGQVTLLPSDPEQAAATIGTALTEVA
jgi:hypothetical protein